MIIIGNCEPRCECAIQLMSTEQTTTRRSGASRGHSDSTTGGQEQLSIETICTAYPVRLCAYQQDVSEVIVAERRVRFLSRLVEGSLLGYHGS